MTLLVKSPQLIINDVYSRDISRKIRPALAAKRQRGEFLGAWAPYGYRKCAENSHRLEPDEETAPVVRLIFQWRLSGMSYSQIARELNDKGIPSPARSHYLVGDVKAECYANTVWRLHVIKMMLANEVYLGHMVQGRKQSGFGEGRKTKVVPKSDWVIVCNTHKPLIDEETFKAVQEIAKEKHSAYYERLGRYDELGSTPNILRGLIFCSDCNRPLTRYKSVTNKGRNLFYVFICPTHTADPKSCPKKYLHEAELKEVLWDVIKDQIELAGRMEKLVHQYSRSIAATSREKTLEREANTARQALERARMLYDSLYQNYVDRLMSEHEYVELKQHYRADIERAQARLEEVKQQQQTELRNTRENPWLTAFRHYLDATELTEESAHALIERVTVDADNHIDIKLRYQDECHTLIQLLEKEGG